MGPEGTYPTPDLPDDVGSWHSAFDSPNDSTPPEVGKRRKKRKKIKTKISEVIRCGRAKKYAADSLPKNKKKKKHTKKKKSKRRENSFLSPAALFHSPLPIKLHSHGPFLHHTVTKIRTTRASNCSTAETMVPYLPSHTVWQFGGGNVRS